jgi:hypothetical protein
MLRHAHLYMKGGLRPFAALCMEVCCAGQSGLVQVRLLLTQHSLSVEASFLLRRGVRR